MRRLFTFETTTLALMSVTLLGALFASGGCTGAGSEAAETATEADESAVVVETASVERRQLTRRVEVSTTLAPSRTLRVTPEVGGVAEEIHFHQGDSVDEGDPLVRISSVDYSLAVESARSQKSAAQAGIKQAKARLETAKKQYERFEKLYESDVVAKAQFEEVEAAYEQAKAAYRSAKARADRAATGVRQARTRVSDTVVRAPFDGHVVRRLVDEGAVLRPMASPVMVLIDDDPIWARASVGELKVPEVETGMEATVEVDAFPDRTFTGKVTMVNRQVAARTREAAIRVTLPNEEGRLRAGMSGTVAIELGSRQKLVIPRTALVEREGTRAVVYVVESGKARRRNVEIVPGFEAELPVEKGLSQGERVVTWGVEQVRDGIALQVESSGASDAPDGPDAGSDEPTGGDR